MELTAAARRHLLTDETITGYVVDRVWKDRLEESLDGTGRRAVVLKSGGGWARPQERNTQEYPLLRVEAWADHSRNETTAMTVADGLTSAQALWRAVDRLIHGIRDEWWGGFPSEATGEGLLVVGCSRWSEPRAGQTGALASGRPAPGDSDSFEAQCWVCDYAVQIIH